MRFPRILIIFAVSAFYAQTASISFGTGTPHRWNLYALEGDVDRDNTVDLNDISLFAQHWLNSGCEDTNQWCTGSDINASTSVDFIDYALIAKNWSRNILSQNVCRTPVINPSPLFDYTPVGVDPVEGLCYCVNLTIANKTNGITTLYSTSNGIDFTTAFSITDTEPFKTYYDLSPTQIGITRIVKMGDGGLLLALGIYSSQPWDANKPRGAIFRKDPSTGVWTKVLSMPYGFVPQWGLNQSSIINNHVVVGEYGNASPNVSTNNPRQIYYSNDYGATWATAYTEPGDATGASATTNGRHCHMVSFAPGDPTTIIAFYGDVNRQVIRLTNSGGAWTKDTTFAVDKLGKAYIQNVSGATDGTYLYLGCDQTSCFNVQRYHQDSNGYDVWKTVVNEKYVTGNAITPYHPAFNTGHVFGILYESGVYYALLDNAAISRTNGILVSSDGEYWTYAYRNASTIKGCFTIFGYANGYLWAAFNDASSIPNLKGTKFLPVNPKTCSAMVCERGLTNQITLTANSTFDEPISIGVAPTQWSFSSDADLGNSGRYIFDGRSDGNCLRYVRGTRSTGCGTILLPTMNTLVSALPTANKYVILSLWIKTDPTSGPLPSISIRLSSAPANVKSGVAPTDAPLPYENGWRKLCYIVKTNAEYTNETWRYQIIVEDNGDGNQPCITYFDDFQITYADDTSDIEARYGTAEVVRNAETITLPLPNAGRSITTTFEWQPKVSCLGLPSTIPIALLIGSDGSYIYIYWSLSTTRISFTNGIATYTTAESYAFRDTDFIRFAIITNPDGTTLYIQDVLNGLIALADNNDVILSDVPTNLVFGRNLESTAIGIGCYLYPEIWDTNIDSNDIVGVMETNY